MSRGSGRGNVVVDNLNQDYAQAIYEDGDVTYICKASLGSALNSPVWQVKMFDSGSVPNQMLWANGAATFINLATNLATVRALSYS